MSKRNSMKFDSRKQNNAYEYIVVPIDVFHELCIYQYLRTRLLVYWNYCIFSFMMQLDFNNTGREHHHQLSMALLQGCTRILTYEFIPFGLS